MACFAAAAGIALISLVIEKHKAKLAEKEKVRTRSSMHRRMSRQLEAHAVASH